MRKKSVTEGIFSYLDWIAKNGTTQFYGPTAIGKSTILKSLRDNWPGNCLLIKPGPTGLVDSETNPITGCLRITAKAPSMERMLKAVGILFENTLTENDLVIVDDTSEFALENGTPAGNSQAWGLFLRHTREHGVTVVLGTQTRRVDQGVPAAPNSPRRLSFHLDIRYELQEIARGAEGVVVEVHTCKSRHEMAGGVKGRLWVRPHHKVPVRTT